MKKLFLAIAFFSCLASFAQLSVKKLDGTPIITGDVFTFHQLEEPDNYLGFKLYNTSAASIKVKARVVSVTNSTGTDLQLCIGDVCLNSITAGNSYPSSPVTIQAGGQNSNFDHILNNNPGIDTSAPVEYVIRISQVNDSGVEIGTPVTFTYRYTSVLASETFAPAQNDVTLKSSIVSSTLDIRAAKNVLMELFDVNGKSIRRENLASGDHSIDVSDLSSGIYILSFNTETNQKSTAKFIKK